LSLTNVWAHIYQSRLIYVVRMDTSNIPCAYDLEGYDDRGDDADADNGGTREQTTWESLCVVAIWVSSLL